MTPALLAEFCARLPLLRRTLRGPESAGERALVEEAAAAVRNGEPVEPLLDKLGFGIAPGTRVTEVFGPSHGVTGAYVCPRGKCGRVVHRKAGDDLPTCPLFERDLRFVADG